MSMIHFIGGEKGGVGKSVFARLLSQYFIDNDVPFVGLDADRSHASLTRFYEQFTDAINLDTFESTDKIMELALEQDTNVLVDLPAQSERFLDRWIEENDVLGMCEETGIEIVYWYLVDGGKDSVQLLKKFLPKYSVVMTCAVVKNEGRGSDFSEVDDVIASVTSSANGTLKEVVLPALHTPTMQKIDKNTFSFWAAANAKENGTVHLNLMERQRTKVWLRKAYTMFDTVLAQH
ncbi:hypothetical protein WCX18_04120 [Sulfurimonas sp. HSL1-2]|uniref:hypothetical protein n=1 Tax=Thiomicrolovo zhangzhouensis TaxID=3131933 RepID=UPI0031F8886B